MDEHGHEHAPAHDDGPSAAHRHHEHAHAPTNFGVAFAVGSAP